MCRTQGMSPLNVSSAVVYDRTGHYYAIGNSPPVQLIPSGVPNPQILCLAAGDPRSVMFSVSRSDTFGEGGGDVLVHFVINDVNPFIIARNAVLLTLALKPADGDALQLWAVWHSLSLTMDQWACMRAVLRELLDDPSIAGLVKYRGDTLKHCRRIWEQWLSWKITTAEAETLRDSHLCARHKCAPSEVDAKLRIETGISFVREGYLGGALHYSDHPPVHLPGLHVHEVRLRSVVQEAGLFDATGLTGTLDSRREVNRSLFSSPDRFTLHSSTKFFQGFPLWHFGPQEQTLLEHCRTQLAEWARDLRARRDSLQITFATGDCLALCTTSPDWRAYFDIIDTSNVCDHIGLAPLLLSCRNVISPKGVLRTTSLTFFGEFESDGDYFQEHLVVEPGKWPDIYGWHRDGQDPDARTVHVEWPLVSPRGRISFQWRPSGDRHARDELSLERIMRKITVECEQLQGDAGSARRMLLATRQTHLHYSLGTLVLLIMHNTPSPLDFVQQQIATGNVPNCFHAELETWIAALSTSTAIVTVPGTNAAKWVEVEIADGEALFEHSSQPWLQAAAMCGGEPAIFSCLVMGMTEHGRTSRVSFLAPHHIDVSSVALHDFNVPGGRVHHSEVRSSTTLPAMEALRIVLSVSQDDAVTPLALRAGTSTVLIGTVTCGATSPRRPHGLLETAAYRRATTGMMLKSELLISRAVGTGNDISHEDPLLELKELLLSFFGSGTHRTVVCAGDGAGTVPLVIVMESLCQDEISGVPLADLIVFQPSTPFSSSSVPRELEAHHAEDALIHHFTPSRKARELFMQIVQLLGAQPCRTECAWGMTGAIVRVLFPPLFPSRATKMREVINQINLEVKLKIFDLGPDRTIEKMTALKFCGNALMAEGRIDQATFSYMLGASKIEDGSVNCEDASVRRLAAECHCNIALVKLRIGDSDALVNADRSCGAAIALQPSWAKPYFRRGLCREQQNALQISLADLRKASQLSPKERAISGALARVQSKIRDAREHAKRGTARGGGDL